MKKTISIAALAVSASTSFAFVGPNPSRMEHKTYCLDVYTDADGNMEAGNCDQSANNAQQNLWVGRNGCASQQIALTTSKRQGEANFAIKIRPCLPPNVAQL